MWEPNLSKNFLYACQEWDFHGLFMDLGSASYSSRKFFLSLEISTLVKYSFFSKIFFFKARMFKEIPLTSMLLEYSFDEELLRVTPSVKVDCSEASKLAPVAVLE